MEQPAVKDEKAYRQVLGAFTGAVRRKTEGLTVADVVARTALPLEKVKELLPIAACEYEARLRVTSSGEILYAFPVHLKSKYKGAGARLRRIARAVCNGVKKAAAALFKVWIMVMLVGYFVLFMLIALAALVLSVASNSQNNSGRRDSEGGMFLFSGILNMIIRIWFYSELTKSLQGGYGGGYSGGYSRGGYGWGGGGRARPKGKPLYKAIFSFVFGDGDPNADAETRERQAFIAYVQANDGVISQPEFMMITGLSPREADDKILEYCVRFGGSPEPTEDGTVVYVFRDVLLRAAEPANTFKGFSAPLRRLASFSSNEKKLNTGFGVINTVNLLFGGYFLHGALTVGPPLLQVTNGTVRIHGLYDFTYFMAQHFLAMQNPLPAMLWGLGVVPLAFSAFFWLIPAIRSRFVKKENEKTAMRNLRKIGYKTVFDKRLEVRASDIAAQARECRPARFESAREKVIQEMGGYSVPSVSLDPLGEAVYSFTALDDEFRALQKFRIQEQKNAPALGSVIFDSGA